MNLIIGKWQFCPRLITSLFAFVFFVLFLSLGSWQLDRAEYKRTLHEEFLSRQTEAEIDLSQLNSYEDDSNFLWRPVSGKGHFYEEIQVLLDNQVVKGKPGYFVYTPFKPDTSDFWLLVNRGWVVAGNDRTKVPELILKTDEAMLKGIIKEPPKTGMLLAESVPEKMNEVVMRVQSLDLNQLETLLNKKFMPVIVRLEPDSDHGYLRDWRLPGSGESTHLGYAFQWFAFATVLLVIYLFVNIKKSEETGKADD